MRSRSLISSAATRRRVLPATSRGRTVASSALAWAADRSFFAPPGISSSSSRCSWAIIRVWASPSERRRSTSSRSTASCSSLTTGRSPVMRVPTSATECASVASVLRPWPVANTRARADSFGGTSTTVLAVGDQPVRDVPADAAAALDRPRPIREPPRRARASPDSRSRSVPNRPPPSTVSSPAITSIVADRLCGSIPMTTALIVHLSSARTDHGCRAGRAPLLRAEQTPLEPLPAQGGARPAQAK